MNISDVKKMHEKELDELGILKTNHPAYDMREAAKLTPIKNAKMYPIEDAKTRFNSPTATHENGFSVEITNVLHSLKLERLSK